MIIVKDIPPPLRQRMDIIKAIPKPKAQYGHGMVPQNH